MKSDIEIAKTIEMSPIEDIAEQIGISKDKLEHYGKYIAKVPYNLINDVDVQESNLILITSISPTKYGNGKTTVAIGIADALNSIEENSACLALREPSLGPVFGQKGGATGGGMSQILPMEKINMHFTGDLHAITSANNLISACLDNYIWRHKKSDEPQIIEVFWKRVLDMNDRNLRQIITGIGESQTQQTGFDITAASEIMAILCLAQSEDDLRERIDDIILGRLSNGEFFRVKDLGCTGSVMSLLSDAINPNLVQTIAKTPAFVHGGPFANVAHGCNSIIATKMAMSHAKYVLTEAGFGADLGAEKFFNIKCRTAGISPKAVVITITIRSLKENGTVDNDYYGYNLKLVESGLSNLERHYNNMSEFGVPVIVTLNKFEDDDPEEIKVIEKWCSDRNIRFVINSAWFIGGRGCLGLALQLREMIENPYDSKINYTYDLLDDPKTKIIKICKNIYKAVDVQFEKKALNKLKMLGEEESKFPICIAKTQYSFTDDQTKLGAPTDFTFHIKDIVIYGGAKMIVALAGDMVRMPGLPKLPQANVIDMKNGEIFNLS